MPQTSTSYIAQMMQSGLLLPHTLVRHRMRMSMCRAFSFHCRLAACWFCHSLWLPVCQAVLFAFSISTRKDPLRGEVNVPWRWLPCRSLQWRQLSAGGGGYSRHRPARSLNPCDQSFCCFHYLRHSQYLGEPCSSTRKHGRGSPFVTPRHHHGRDAPVGCPDAWYQDKHRWLSTSPPDIL